MELRIELSLEPGFLPGDGAWFGDELFEDCFPPPPILLSILASLQATCLGFRVHVVSGISSFPWRVQIKGTIRVFSEEILTNM
jgi:hypothetical protein